LSQRDPDHAMKRSSTTGGGEQKNVDDHRTSENAWVSFTETALVLKDRVMRVLGLTNWDTTFQDGLQVLRYRTGTGYNTHFDFISSTPNHNGHPVRP
jgi:hypothetical protein